MPQYLTPGVYVEEVPGAKPIEGVGTATGAFVGVAEKGPIGEAVLITNWTQYTSVFGGYIADGYLPYAVNNFFTEGGTKCYVVRTCHYTDVTQASSKTAKGATATLEDRGSPKNNTLQFEALSEGSWGDGIAVVVSRGKGTSDTKFDLAILYNGLEVEKYSDLSIGDVEGAINGVSKYVKVSDQRSTTAAPNNQPDLSTVDLTDRLPTQPTLEIVALQNVTASVTDTGNTFTLSVTPSGGPAVDVQNLTMANVEAQVNAAASALVRVRNLNSTTAAPDNRPRAGAVAGLVLPTEVGDRAVAPLPALGIVALQGGVTFRIDDGTNANTFKLTVSSGAGAPQVFDNLTPANVEATVNIATSPVRVRDLASPTAPPANLPAVTGPAANTMVPLLPPLQLQDRRAAQPTVRVTALARNLRVTIADGATPNTVDLTIRQNGSQVEPTFESLRVEDFERRINGISGYIRVQRLTTNPTPVPLNRPANTGVDLTFFALAGGWDGLAGAALKDRAAPTSRNTLFVSAWREGVTVSIENATVDSTNAFKIVVKAGGAKVEEFDELTLASVEQVVNEKSGYIEVNDMSSSTAVPANRPATQADTLVSVGLWDSDFIGDEGAKNGLHAFDPVDDINIVAIPDRPGDREVIIGAYTYCQNRKDCFYVADAPMGLTPQEAQQFKEGTGSIYAGNAFNTSFAALYYPWIYISDPLTGKNKLVPPSGAVAGSYSYTDVARGVHKAPAGINEGYLNSAVAIERLVTKGEQELLNPIRVNVIRSFPASGIVIWGARTLSADTAVLYINVRRLLLFIEESIDKGSQWVVFEPNDRTLWAAVKRDVTAFLTTVWRSGALFGSTAAEAFFVKIDDENNPPESRDLGRLVIDVGVAPVKPAEFVIFRISQIVQGAKG